MLAALLLLALRASAAPAPSLCPFDRIVPLEISASDPRLEGQGPSKRIEYTSGFSGTLHVWTKVAGDLDTFLRLEESDDRGSPCRGAQ